MISEIENRVRMIKEENKLGCEAPITNVRIVIDDLEYLLSRLKEYEEVVVTAKELMFINNNLGAHEGIELHDAINKLNKALNKLKEK